MRELLLHLMGQLNSSVIVLIVTLLLVVFAVYKLGRLVEKFTQHENRLLGVESIRDLVVELRTKVNMIYNNTNPNAVVINRSPLALTDFGKGLAKSIDAEALYAKYASDMLNALRKRCPEGSNAYDIQVAAMDIAAKELPNKLDAEEVNRLKQCAYNKGMPFDDIWPIFGIYLRDAILQERSIPVLDVDKHDPYKAN